jgi:hypothetical protein
LQKLKTKNVFRYPLKIGPDFTGTTWMLPPPSAKSVIYNLQVQLPAGLVCKKQCIFQVSKKKSMFASEKI